MTDALVLFDYYRDETDWVRYLALHRHGGIEIAASRCSYEVQETRVLFLRKVVGLVWIAADLQAEAAEQWDPGSLRTDGRSHKHARGCPRRIRRRMA